MLSHDAWRKVESGVRPSTVLLVGVIGIWLAGILPFFEAGEIPEKVDRRLASWWFWGLSLVATGAGLLMAGGRQWLHRYATVPGAIYLAQAVALGFVLAGSVFAPFFYVILSLPKLLALFVLPILERETLGTKERVWLAVAAALGALKSGIHAFLPDLNEAMRIPDLLVNLQVGTAFFLVSRALRKEETIWAMRVAQDIVWDFGRFNNPLNAEPDAAPKAKEEQAG